MKLVLNKGSFHIQHHPFFIISRFHAVHPECMRYHSAAGLQLRPDFLFKCLHAVGEEVAEDDIGAAVIAVPEVAAADAGTGDEERAGIGDQECGKGKLVADGLRSLFGCRKDKSAVTAAEVINLFTGFDIRQLQHAPHEFFRAGHIRRAAPGGVQAGQNEHKRHCHPDDLEGQQGKEEHEQREEDDFEHGGIVQRFPGGGMVKWFLGKWLNG